MQQSLRTSALFWVLLVTTLAMGGLTAAPPAEAQSTTTFDYTQVEGLSQPEYPKLFKKSYRVPVPGAGDEAELYVEVTRPDPQEYDLGPLPVVMEASPYHGTLADREGTRIFPDPRDPDDEDKMIGLTGYFAQRGYAVVMVDLRGTGRSSGCLDHLGPEDAGDLKRIVEWAASQPWSNGRVGMTGHSYVGSTPKVAAAQNPEGLVTIAPSAGLASMYDHQYQYGVPYLLQWVGPMFAYEQLSLERHAPGGDNFGNPDAPPEECAVLESSLVSDESQVTGKYDDDAPFAWHAQRDWRQGALGATIPVFMIHGVNDNAARIPAAEWFFGNRYNRPDDKVWIGQWDHGSSANTTCAQGHPNCRFEQWQYALHAWFDKHLAQRPVDTGPPVEVFLNGDVVYTDTEWRAPVFETMYPDATDMSLKIGEAPVEVASETFPVVPVEGGSIEFVSEAVEQDTLIRGLPQQVLHASLSNPQNQVFWLVTTLYNESPDGETRIPMNYCAIQPSLRNNPPPDGEFFKPTNHTPIVPGEEMALDPLCFTMAHHLPKDHKLVLEVSTQSPHHVSGFIGLANPFADEVTIYTGPTKSNYDVPWVTAFTTVDDIAIPVPGVPQYTPPDAPAQPPVCGDVVIPATGGEFRIDGFNVAYFEFDALPQYGNARFDVLATPSTPADVDLFLQYKKDNGKWSEELGVSGGGSFDFEKETMSYSNPFPARYRVGVVSWAGQPALEVEVCVTFFDAAGNAGVQPEDNDRDRRDPRRDEDPQVQEADPVLPATGGGAGALAGLGLFAVGLIVWRRRR